MEKLDRVHKKFIKQVLSLPHNVADPAIYIIARALPVEAIIHTRALSLFGSVSCTSTTAESRAKIWYQ